MRPATPTALAARLHPCERDGKKRAGGPCAGAKCADHARLSIIHRSQSAATDATPAPAGFFEAFIENRTEVFLYRCALPHHGEYASFTTISFCPRCPEADLYLINRQRPLRLPQARFALARAYGRAWRVFAVWAPSAKRVSVVGDFNQWDGRYHAMRSSGLLAFGEISFPARTRREYKYEIFTGAGILVLRRTPTRSFNEPPPHNAAIVWNLEGYE